MSTRADAELTLRDLREAPEAIARALDALCKARDEAQAAKETLQLRREEYDATLAAATLTAYASGVLTGKNQAERDAQLAGELRKDANVGYATQDKRNAETMAERVDLAVRDAEGAVKAAVYRLQAAQSAAMLQAQLLSMESMARAPERGSITASAQSVAAQVQRERTLPVWAAPSAGDDPLFR
jgi:hypothetical protein